MEFFLRFFFFNVDHYLKIIYFSFISRLFWVFVAECRFSLAAVRGFLFCRAQALGTQASAVAARCLSSCGTQA